MTNPQALLIASSIIMGAILVTVETHDIRFAVFVTGACGVLLALGAMVWGWATRNKS